MHLNGFSVWPHNLRSFILVSSRKVFLLYDDNAHIVDDDKDYKMKLECYMEQYTSIFWTSV